MPVNGVLAKVRKAFPRSATIKTTIATERSTTTSPHKPAPAIAEQAHRLVVPENGALATRRVIGLVRTIAEQARKAARTTHGDRATLRVLGPVRTLAVAAPKHARTTLGELVLCAHKLRPATIKMTTATARSTMV